MEYEQDETNELEWYFRDLLFRNHNKGILQLEIESIPTNMVEIYLRYRNEEFGHISSILEIVLENLVSSKLIERLDNLVSIRDGISRLQCSKCYYICYLANLEVKSCLRCQSNELVVFPKKRFTLISLRHYKMDKQKDEPRLGSKALLKLIYRTLGNIPS